MTTRAAARDTALRTGAVVTSALVVAVLAGTGAALGVLVRPEPPVLQADPPQQPRPKRTVYVRVVQQPTAVPPTTGGIAQRLASTSRVQQPARRAALRPPARPPRRVEAPPVTTSSAS